MKLTYYILALLIILPYAGMIGLRGWYKHELNDINNASFIVISKEDMMLRLIDYKGREVQKYPIACGKNYGNKETKGDLKTPEGLFHVTEIEKASSWVHDFGDGKGEISGAYGPFFIRLEIPGQKGIGIHGTHKPESIGTRDTEGCIRLNNGDLLKLVKQTHIGMAVFITPAYMDVIKSGKVDSLKLAMRAHEESVGASKKPNAASFGKTKDQEIKTTTFKIKLKSQ
ncbi:MAG: L,D-transpeptidase [Prevotella sp.]